MVGFEFYEFQGQYHLPFLFDHLFSIFVKYGSPRIDYILTLFSLDLNCDQESTIITSQPTRSLPWWSTL